MKSVKFILVIVMAMMCGSLSACGKELKPIQSEESGKESKILTVYFSCTGTTKNIAEKVHKAAGGDIIRIEPQVPYSSADLDYNTDCRANREQNDASARPAIKSALPSMDSYDVIFLGYPIWWGKAPKIVYTFLENANFKGKTIIPFCTSGSSGVRESEPGLHALAPDATWGVGRRFASNASQSSINDWVKSVGGK